MTFHWDRELQQIHDPRARTTGLHEECGSPMTHPLKEIEQMSKMAATIWKELHFALVSTLCQITEADNLEKLLISFGFNHGSTYIHICKYIHSLMVSIIITPLHVLTLPRSIPMLLTNSCPLFFFSFYNLYIHGLIVSWRMVNSSGTTPLKENDPSSAKRQKLFHS